MHVCVCVRVYLSPINNINAKLVKSDICLKSVKSIIYFKIPFVLTRIFGTQGITSEFAINQTNA